MPRSFRSRPGRSSGVSRRVTVLMRLTVATVVIGLFSACAGRLPNPFQRGASQQVTLTVESRNWVDHTIYVSRGGARTRLGTITSQQTRTFRLPADIATPGSSVRFQADPVGSSRIYSSPEVSVSGGETWVWTLMPQIDQSTLIIR